MSVNVVKVLEGLCEASDDVVYYGLRSCGDDEKNSQTKFNLVWDKSVETFQDMADEITELRDMLKSAKLAMEKAKKHHPLPEGHDCEMLRQNIVMAEKLLNK